MSVETAEGRVLGIENSGAGSTARARVAVDRLAACRRCAKGKGCGAGLNLSSSTAELTVAVPHDLELSPGDSVELHIAGATLTRASLIAYGLPLLGIVIAAGIAVIAETGDGRAVAAAFAGLGLGVLLARRQVGNVEPLCSASLSIVAVSDRPGSGH